METASQDGVEGEQVQDEGQDEGQDANDADADDDDDKEEDEETKARDEADFQEWLREADMRIQVCIG